MIAVEEALSIVLVEGESDQIALDTLAERQGRDLALEGVAIVAMGGAHAIDRHLRRFASLADVPRLSGMCDAAERRYFERALDAANVGTPTSVGELEQLGFFVCDPDLEGELIAAAGGELIESLLAEHGDLAAFRTFQKQAPWRDADFDAQMHRWLRAGYRRTQRYARLFVLAIEPDRIPRPLISVLRAATPR